jgi:hypothetical protein
MNKSVLLMAGLLFVSVASGAAASTCSQELEGKQSCLSGEMMKCVKIFDPNSKAFKYELEGINANGQSINVNSPLYKKTAGYTPMSCADSNSAKK